MKINKFSEEIPEYNQGIAFVCPIQKDRWEIGWMDTSKIRIEGGESYKPEELTLWFILPNIPRE